MSISLPPSSVSRLGTVGVGQGGGTTAGTSPVTELSGRVAARIAAELGLAPSRGGLGHDPYRIADTAAALASGVHATPQEAGEIERVLTEFVQAATALISAQPGAASVESVARAAASVSGASAALLVASLKQAAVAL